MGQIRRVNGEIAAFLNGRSCTKGIEVLPSGLILPVVELLFGELGYVGDGKFAFVVDESGDLELRVVDAVNSVMQEQRFGTPNPGTVPSVHISGADGCIYFMWRISMALSTEASSLQVVKRKRDAMEVIWQRTLSYNISRQEVVRPTAPDTPHYGAATASRLRTGSWECPSWSAWSPGPGPSSA